MIRYAIPKYELFALIDEGIDIPGYSLISRGKYPNRLTREELKKIEFNFKTSRLKIILKKFLPKFIFLSLSKVNSILKRIVHTLNYMT